MAKKMTTIELKDIDLIVYDFDGVLTDNRVLVTEDGKEAVFCHRGDGLAIQMIKNQGVPQIILSTEQNKVVKARAQKLKIAVLHGVQDKRKTLAGYCKKNHFALKRVLYIGNDVNDLEVMKCVGFPLAPLDANKRIKKLSKIIVQKNGGDGVVREFFDSVLV